MQPPNEIKPIFREPESEEDTYVGGVKVGVWLTMLAAFAVFVGWRFFAWLYAWMGDAFLSLAGLLVGLALLAAAAWLAINKVQE